MPKPNLSLLLPYFAELRRCWSAGEPFAMLCTVLAGPRFELQTSRVLPYTSHARQSNRSAIKMVLRIPIFKRIFVWLEKGIESNSLFPCARTGPILTSLRAGCKIKVFSREFIAIHHRSSFLYITLLRHRPLFSHNLWFCNTYRGEVKCWVPMRDCLLDW